jgi:hypothetical protein
MRLVTAVIIKYIERLLGETSNYNNEFPKVFYIHWPLHYWNVFSLLDRLTCKTITGPSPFILANSTHLISAWSVHTCRHNPLPSWTTRKKILSCFRCPWSAMWLAKKWPKISIHFSVRVFLHHYEFPHFLERGFAITLLLTVASTIRPWTYTLQADDSAFCWDEGKNAGHRPKEHREHFLRPQSMIPDLGARSR